jgi:pseudouridine synthase
MRLNAWLARAGVSSRRGADELIKAGRVTVDGQPGQLNTFVAARAEVSLDGEPLSRQRLAYILLNKPAGVVTTLRDPGGRPTVAGLVDHPSRVVPVGRLDAETTGALLLTNDGELAHRLAHPRYGVDKVYEAQVRGEPTRQRLAALAAGVELEDGMTAPAVARRLAANRVEVSVHEGRNRQVRRMLEAVGLQVVSLERTSYAGLTLAGLAAGAWRELSASELELLRAAPHAPSRARETRRSA